MDNSKQNTAAAKEKMNNMNLNQEMEFIKHENKAFLYKLCEIEHIQSTENKDEIIRLLLMKYHSNSHKLQAVQEPFSIRNLMIVSIFCVRLKMNTNNSKVSLLQKEITKAKIKAICAIYQAPENVIRKATTHEMLITILNQTIRPGEVELMDKLLSLIDKMLSNVKLYKLGCNISKEAAMLSYSTMKKGE